MGKLYAPIRQIIGPSGTIIPIGDPGFGKPDATTFTTFGDQQVTFTWSEAWRNFDGHNALADSPTFPYRFQGIIPIIEFNGTDEEADTPDAAFWSRNDAGGANGFSVGAWVNVTDTATARIILSKWDDTGAAELREWDFFVDGSDLLTLTLGDESVNIFVNRHSDAAIKMGELRFFVATYDGTGGNTAMNGATLYDNGNVLASTAANNSSYVGMEPLVVQPALGRIFGSGLFFNGNMLGGPLGPFFTHKELSLDDIKQLYDLGRKTLWL